jgi:TetR/AcrR family transcriptional repressor of bet genes
MPRPTNTEERRSQITSGLLKVMAKHGYDGASIADVAKAAGLTPGLVHYHFKNKQEILVAALRELGARHASNLEACLTPDGDAIVELSRFVDLHLSTGSSADPETLACWILFSGEALRQPKVRNEYEKILQASISCVSELIRRGIKQKLLRCDAPESAAVALVATIEGYFVMAGTARKLIPKGSAAKTTKRMLEGIVKPTRSLLGERQS